MQPFILVLVIFLVGMIIGFIVSAGVFRPRWVDILQGSDVSHDGIIILQFANGTLHVVRNLGSLIDVTPIGVVRRYMKL